MLLGWPCGSANLNNFWNRLLLEATKPTVRPEVALVQDGDADPVVVDGLDVELHGGVPARLTATRQSRLPHLRPKARLTESLRCLA